MKSIYDKNIACVREEHQELYRMLNNRESDISEIHIDVEKIGQNTVLYAEKSGNIVQLSSMYDEEWLANVWAESISKTIKYDSKIFIFGLGCGSYIRSLLEYIGDDNLVFVYEPSIYMFRTVLNHFDISDILVNKKVRIEIGEGRNISIRSLYYNDVNYADIFSCCKYILPNYPNLFLNEYEEYINQLSVLLYTVEQERFFSRDYGKFMNANVFNNINDLINSRSIVSLSRNIPKEIPAIIVSAGPSLSNNIEELKNAKGKAFIIAVDSALKALVKANIIPDMVATIDPDKGIGYFDEEKSKQVPLLCDVISTKELVNANKGLKFMIASNENYHKVFSTLTSNKLQYLPAGGTVAFTALSFVVHIGLSTVIFVGQDLAFTGNKTHAANTVQQDVSPEEDRVAKTYVKDVNGNDILTSESFLLYKHLIEEFIEVKNEVKYINSTEGGAYIQGCEHISLRSAIDNECKNEYDLGEIIQSTNELFSDIEKDSFILQLSQMPTEMLNIKKLSLEGMDKYQKMLELIYMDKYHGKQFSSTFEKIKVINERIENSIYSIFISNEIQRELTDDLNEIYTSNLGEREELISLCKKGEKHFQNIISATENISNLYGKTKII